MATSTPEHTLGVGLISVGWMGRLHSRAYTNLPLIYPELGVRPRLIQAADPAEGARDYARDVLGYASTTADYTEVLNNPDVDVVSICAPNFLHEEIGVAAAKAGKPFWIEKPVGRGAEETARIRDAAVKAGVITTIGFNYRQAPAIAYTRQLLASGALGRITNIRGRFFGGFNADPEAPLAWRFVRRLSGSGVLGDLMGHLVDLVHYLLGPLGSVSAATGTYITERPALPGSPHDGTLQPVENEDYASMLVRFDDSALAAGALGNLEASWIAVGPKAEYGLEIFGTKGSLRWNFERLNELELAIQEPGRPLGYTTIMADETFPEFSRFQPASGTSMGYDDLKTIEAYRFVDAVLNGATGHSTIHDALASAQVLTAAEESTGSGRWVDLPVVPGSTAQTIQNAQSDEEAR